jgi:translation initiation factor 4E
LAKTLIKMEHETEFRWSLHCTAINKKVKAKTKAAWEAKLKNIFTLGTVEEFWGLVELLKKPSEIQGRGDYFFFKEHIKPEWEDPHNANGGAWLYRSESGSAADEAWQEVLLALVGCQLNMELVCGACLSVRPSHYRVAVWTSNTDDALMRTLGLELQKTLRGAELVFEKHGREGLITLKAL